MKYINNDKLDYFYDDIDYLLCYAYVTHKSVYLYSFVPLGWN